MSNRNDALLVQAVFAFAQGCSGARIDEDAAGWFHTRYGPWVGKVKKIGKSPADAWDEYGKDFLQKFKEIGTQAAKGGNISMKSLTDAITSVESASECPYCPDKP